MQHDVEDLAVLLRKGSIHQVGEGEDELVATGRSLTHESQELFGVDIRCGPLPSAELEADRLALILRPRGVEVLEAAHRQLFRFAAAPNQRQG